MSSTSKRRGRQKIAKQDLFRLTPIEVRDQEIVKGTQTSVIDVPATDYLVVQVPPTMSYTAAVEVEKELEKALKRPILVVTSNISILAVEGPLSRKEVGALIKGLEGDASAIVEQIFNTDEEPTEPTTEDPKTDLGKDILASYKASQEEKNHKEGIDPKEEGSEKSLVGTDSV